MNKTSFKNKILIILLLLLIMIIIPILSVKKNRSSVISAFNSKKASDKNISSENNNYFKVLDEATNKIIDIPEKELIYATVASEMPALYEPEALKAQAIASFTYFYYTKSHKPESQEYDFKINTDKNINFITEDHMRKNWGSHFEEYFNKIKNAVNDVWGKAILKNNEPIFAAYHAISSGKTEKSSDVFKSELDYLINVESDWDKSATGYETKSEFAAENLKNILINEWDDCHFESPPENWFQISEKTPAGSVKEISVASHKTKGSEIRRLFALRSSNFNVDYNADENKFIFTTFGYGHGVGMSQFGANYMAKQGNNYEKILNLYYPNTQIDFLN